MKKTFFKYLFFCLVFSACHNSVKKNKTRDSDFVDIMNIHYKDNKNQLVEIEQYIYRDTKDTFDNQYKYYDLDNKIIRSKSKYYVIENLINNEEKKTTGLLSFFSPYENLNNITEKEVEFSFLQKKNDSIFYKKYDLDPKTWSIAFEYKDFDHNSLYGYIREVIVADTTLPTGKKMSRIIETITLVDNKNPSLNPYDLREN